jgi:hypothetical protein
MRISGFTMVKNADKLYYPIKESITSILPIVDEFIIALGDCDEDDSTRKIIESIGSSKIKIINTVWDTKAYPRGSELAHQTDIAKSHCSGDWLFYLQADEIIHEKDLETIKTACHKHLEDNEVQGLLFRYIHFWGDYEHAFQFHHCWYRHEIRIVRNHPDIHSWKDAQSFRVIPDFSKEKYLTREGTEKLKVAYTDAYIYHYGWVRPPLLMARKQQRFSACYRKQEDKQSTVVDESKVINYGLMRYVPVYKGTHPQVMKSRIAEFDWADQLNFSRTKKRDIKPIKHERLKYKMMTLIESMFFKRFGLFTFKNFIVVRRNK